MYLKRRQWKPLWNGTESLKTLYFCRMIGPITCIATMCFVCQTICELCLQLDYSHNSTDINNKTTITKKKVSFSKTYVVLISFRHCSRDDRCSRAKWKDTIDWNAFVRLAKFKSRYERHLKTLSHQAYAQCIFFDE